MTFGSRVRTRTSGPSLKKELIVKCKDPLSPIGWCDVEGIVVLIGIVSWILRTNTERESRWKLMLGKFQS